MKRYFLSLLTASVATQAKADDPWPLVAGGAIVAAAACYLGKIAINAFSKNSEKNDLVRSQQIKKEVENTYAQEIFLVDNGIPTINDQLISTAAQIIERSNLTVDGYLKNLSNRIQEVIAAKSVLEARCAQWKTQEERAAYYADAQALNGALTHLHKALDFWKTITAQEKPFLELQEILHYNLESKYRQETHCYNHYGRDEKLFAEKSLEIAQDKGSPNHYPLIKAIEELHHDLTRLERKMLNCTQSPHFGLLHIHNTAFQRATILKDALVATKASVTKNRYYMQEQLNREQAELNKLNAKTQQKLAEARAYEQQKALEVAQAERQRVENVYQQLRTEEERLRNERAGIPQLKVSLAQLKDTNTVLKDENRDLRNSVAQKNTIIENLRNRIARALEKLKLIKIKADFPEHNPDNPGATWIAFDKLADDAIDELKKDK